MNLLRNMKFLTKECTYAEMDSPIGKLTIITSPKGLHAVLWDNDHQNPKITNMLSQLQQSKHEPTFVKTKLQLTEYFNGKRKIFDLPLIMDGTDFQIQVWRQLQKIPYATMMTYAEQAERIGDRKKARAVGTANGLNPISIIVPCHRVIGSNGHLTGFAGGLDKKAFLLNLEKNF